MYILPNIHNPYTFPLTMKVVLCLVLLLHVLLEHSEMLLCKLCRKEFQTDSFAAAKESERVITVAH